MEYTHNLMRNDGALEVRSGNLQTRVPRVLVGEQTDQGRYILRAEIDNVEFS